MNGGHHIRSESGFNELSALFGHKKFWAEQGLSCGGAEGHNHFWFDYSDLSLKPGTTGGDFLSIRFFVDAAFATRLPLKMFDNIGDVSLRAIDSSFYEGFIEEPTGGADERFSSEILFIARLLSDKQHRRAAATFTEDGLRSELPEV